MTEQEYEQKKRECFNGFCKRYRIEEPSEQNIESFDWIHDHAYALGKQEKDADTVIQGWVARDKTGYLVLHYKEPHRTLGGEKWYSAQSQKSLPRESFPDLTWESDPIEVEITIKRKKK